jgi:DNA cross-link repair 1A protein
VDAFGQSSKALGASRTWVLTHFHADHYMGLSKGFKQGRILCTPTTAALVRLKLRVPEQLLVPLPLGQEITVEGERPVMRSLTLGYCPKRLFCLWCRGPAVLAALLVRVAYSSGAEPAGNCFAGTRLQFVDANHCPGAAMVVAHPPGGLPPVLHTGDARLTREATQQQPALQALVGRAVLVLDTTYADPSYCFPPQQEVLQWVLRAVQVGAVDHC